MKGLEEGGPMRLGSVSRLREDSGEHHTQRTTGQGGEELTLTAAPFFYIKSLFFSMF